MNTKFQKQYYQYKNNYTFCNVFDNKEEFDETIRIIKKYYKTNFRV